MTPLNVGDMKVVDGQGFYFDGQQWVAVADTWEARLNCAIEDLGLDIIGADREEFRGAELGISFDGRMIYDHFKLVEILEKQMDHHDACEWVDYNISGDPRVITVLT